MSDLISRSALLEEVKSLTVTVTGLRAGKGVLHEYAKQYRDTLLRIINEQPAIKAVPVVHGYDLISRKMVVQYLQEQQANVIIEKAKKGFVSDDVCDGMKSAVDAFMNFIVQAPSEEAVPVVQGEWIRNENPIEISCECSVCHAKDYWYDIDKANEYYWFRRKFCPNCGAKMDGGSD